VGSALGSGSRSERMALYLASGGGSFLDEEEEEEGAGAGSGVDDVHDISTHARHTLESLRAVSATQPRALHTALQTQLRAL
jgi:hypothetical protein